MKSSSLVRILLSLQLYLVAVAGFKVTKVEVPKYLLVGQKATLKCLVDLEGEKLYTLTWWRDDRQFYKFNPTKNRSAVVFTVPGISVNPAVSTLDTVELVDVQTVSSGQYQCEAVAEGPKFTTHKMVANMTIVDPPDVKPVITGVKEAYRAGDIVNINCTSVLSRPAAILVWTNRKENISEEHLVYYNSTSTGDPPLFNSTLGLNISAHKNTFPKGSLTLSCTAIIAEYTWTNEITLHLDTVTYTQPHHLPTQQQTGGSNRLSVVPLLMLMEIMLLLSTFGK